MLARNCAWLLGLVSSVFFLAYSSQVKIAETLSGTAQSSTVESTGLLSGGRTRPTVYAPRPSDSSDPQPRVYVITSLPNISNYSVLAAKTASDFQKALSDASCVNGTVIRLVSGVSYIGNFTLPSQNCHGPNWIVITTDLPASSLPAPGVRTRPSFSPVLAKILSPNSGPAIQTSPNSNHYLLSNLELGVTATTALNYGVVDIGGTEHDLSLLPDHIFFDRCYFHGNSIGGIKYGLQMHGSNVAVFDSYFENFHLEGQDSQAIRAYSTNGPLKIVNNYLEGSGENVMFGGADPYFSKAVPSDIEIRHNHFCKPLTWKVDDPSFVKLPDGGHWTVKNLLEFKNANRVLVEGNIFESNWADAQTGFAILFTPRNQNGKCPWCVVSNITFRYNLLKHMGSGFNIAGADDLSMPATSLGSSNINIHDNLILDVNGPKWGNAGGRLFQILAAARDGLAPPDNIIIDHNTGFATNCALGTGDIPVSGPTGVVFTNNILSYGTYGIFGSGVGSGNAAISKYFPGSTFADNLFGDSPSSAKNYPSNFYFPSSWAGVFAVPYTATDFDPADYRSISKYSTNDGRPIGADVDLIISAIAGAY